MTSPSAVSHSHSHPAHHSSLPSPPHAFFCRPAEVVGPELVGYRLVKRKTDGCLLWGVVVKTEAYLQGDSACLSVFHRKHLALERESNVNNLLIFALNAKQHCFNLFSKE